MSETKGFAAIGLCNPKFSVNVGHVLRAAYNYRAALIAITGCRDIRTPTNTPATQQNIPVLRVKDLHESIPYDCVPVAVELNPNAVSLVTYKHPRSAFYIFGPEDSSLGKKVLSWCRDIIYIPTQDCLNLAACVSTVLYDRLAKLENK